MGKNENKKRLMDDVAHGQLVNRSIPAYHHRQPVYSDESKKEVEFVFSDQRPARDGGR